MNAEQRRALRAEVDRLRRELVALPDCGASASETTYGLGCRCFSCRKAAADARRIRRQRDADLRHAANPPPTR